jgi:hypothetical protein
MKTDYEEAVKAYTLRVQAKKAEEMNQLSELIEILNYFTPDKAVMIPADIDSFNESMDEVDDGNIRRFQTNRGKFVGYRIKGEEGKLSRGNIEMIFAQLDNQPKVIFKPTMKYLGVLEYMMDASNQPNIYTDVRYIDNWTVDEDRRDVARMITGNILSGYSIAKSMVEKDKGKWKGIKFSRFTTFEGNMIRVGIRLMKADPMADLILTPENAVLITPINSVDVKIASQNLGLNNTIDNDKSDVFIKNMGEREVENVSRKYMALFVVAGKVKENDSSTVSSKSPIKESPLYRNEDFWKSTNIQPQNGLVNKRHISGVGSQRQDKMIKLMVKGIMFEDSEEGWSSIQPLLDYAYDNYKMKIELKGMSGQDVFDQSDVFSRSSEEDTLVTSGRQYKYYPRIPFVLANKPAEFVRFEANESSPNNYGVVYTRSALKPIKAMSYDLLPADLTIPEMWSFYMSQFNETEQREIIKRFETLIAENESNVLIGNYAIKKLTSGIEKFVFGYLSLFQIGEIFRNYLAGNYEQATALESTAPLTEEEQRLISEYEAESIVPINWDSAQDFVILLNHKL